MAVASSITTELGLWCFIIWRNTVAVFYLFYSVGFVSRLGSQDYFSFRGLLVEVVRAAVRRGLASVCIFPTSLLHWISI